MAQADLAWGKRVENGHREPASGTQRIPSAQGITTPRRENVQTPGLRPQSGRSTVQRMHPHSHLAHHAEDASPLRGQ